jgi:hypothetical protein
VPERHAIRSHQASQGSSAVGPREEVNPLGCPHCLAAGLHRRQFGGSMFKTLNSVS